MNRIASAHLSVILGACITFLLTACVGCTGSSSSGSSPLNMAGTWTVTTVSAQNHGNSTGKATVSQSGLGLGVNGSTTFASAVGQIAVSQSGTALTGTITNSMKAGAYNFTGTLSSGSFTATGSTACNSKVTESTNLAGTVSSNSVQGTYTLTSGSGCGTSDAGTFTATKQ